jgi:protease secretion system outer membrane protein
MNLSMVGNGGGWLAGVLMLLVQPAWSIDLVTDFHKAMQFDPRYRGAVADKGVNMSLAEQSRVAFYPEANYNTQRLQNDVSGRRTMTITQPLLSAEKWATWRMQDPRVAAAQSTLMAQQNDLASRLFKAATAVVLAQENHRLNQSKLDALTQQADRARRLYALGQGTVTDLRDLEVKIAQARAQHLLLGTQIDSALRQYAAIVGERPSASTFELAPTQPVFTVPALQVCIDSALEGNPGVQSARMSERVAQLDMERARGAMLPTLSAAYINSTSNNLTNTSTGLVLNMPLQASTMVGYQTAQENYQKALEARREAEEKVRVEVERMWSQLNSGFELLKAQQEAIEAAQLSVEANTRSFQGGVRASVDVANAIQIVFQVRSEYASLAVGQAENLLTLHTLLEATPVDGMSRAQRFLFAP